MIARWKEAGDQPVFIIGMPRSGATLVDQILASHPEARGASRTTTLPTRRNRHGKLRRLNAGAGRAVQKLLFIDGAADDPAVADISLGDGPRPAEDPRAFDAHEVMQRLGPTIQGPQS